MLYSIADFHTISQMGFKITLPAETITLINDISRQVGSPNYIKTPVFNKKETVDLDKKRKRSKYGQRSLIDNNSTLGSSSKVVFKATPIVKREGTNVYIQPIRAILNKFGSTSNEDLKNEIFEIIDTILDTDISAEEVIQIVEKIYDILSNTIFYSKLYSSLFSELISKYDIVADVFAQRFATYIPSFGTIINVNPDDDYDLFCKSNKENDTRKSVTMFNINIYHCGKLETSVMLANIQTLVQKLFGHIQVETDKHFVDEIIENVSLMIMPGTGLFPLCDRINIDTRTGEDTDGDEMNVVDFIRHLATSTKQTKYPGLSPKSVFKLMDLLDAHSDTRKKC